MFKKLFQYTTIAVTAIFMGMALSVNTKPHATPIINTSPIHATNASPAPIINTTPPCEEKVTCTEVGIGWYNGADTNAAIKNAIDMALEGKKYKKPTFAIIFGDGRSNTQDMFDSARKVLGAKTKIYGGISVSKFAKGSAVVITITSPDIKFGVGSADCYRYVSLREAAKIAIGKALESAGVPQKRSPKIVLLTPLVGHETDAVNGIKDVIRGNNIIVCGTSSDGRLDVFGEKNMYASGVSAAVIYTSLPIGYSAIKKAFEKVKKPDEINQLLVWRCPRLTASR